MMSPIFTTIDKQANIFAMKGSSYSRNEFTSAIFRYNIRVLSDSELLALNYIGENIERGYIH